jgi:hypothetical protein
MIPGTRTIETARRYANKVGIDGSTVARSVHGDERAGPHCRRAARHTSRRGRFGSRAIGVAGWRRARCSGSSLGCRTRRLAPRPLWVKAWRWPSAAMCWRYLRASVWTIAATLTLYISWRFPGRRRRTWSAALRWCCWLRPGECGRQSARQRRSGPLGRGTVPLRRWPTLSSHSARRSGAAAMPAMLPAILLWSLAKLR